MKAPPSDLASIPEGQVRIAFDGDAVLFDDSSEIVYKAEGLQSFHLNEDVKQNVPIPEGPYAVFLEKLSRLQKRLPFGVEFSPVHIAIVTARNAPAEMRVIKTLRHWGIYVNEIFFLGGVEKVKVLKAFRPHIFFDDQDLHLDAAAKHVPSGKVPYKSGSPLNENGEYPPALAKPAAHMARSLTVAAIQMRCEPLRTTENLAHAETFVEQAAAQGAELVLLPELMPGGYLLTEEIWSTAEQVTGPSVAQKNS